MDLRKNLDTIEVRIVYNFVGEIEVKHN